MRTEAQRRALNKYNAKTYKTASVKLTLAEYDAMQTAAAADGLTVNGLIKKLLLEHVNARKQTEQPEN